jgi:EpsI family protein
MDRRYIITLILLSATLLLYQASTVQPVSLAQPLGSIANDWHGLLGTENHPSKEDLALVNPTAFLDRTYRSTDASINLFVAYFEQQDAGTIAHSPRACLPFGAWSIVATDSVKIVNGAYRINRIRLQSENRSLLAFYWQQNSERVVASELQQKFFLAWDRLYRHSTSGSIVRVIVEDTPEAQDLGVSFSEWVLPQVARCLRN